MMTTTSHKGFALLIAVILSSVALSIGLALLDISYKQVVLATAGKQSQVAFYAADRIMECALYYDQQIGAFGTPPVGGITCDNGSASVAVTDYRTDTAGSIRTTTFTVPCAGGGKLGSTTVVKNTATNATQLYTQGYNTCDIANPRRIERALKSSY